MILNLFALVLLEFPARLMLHSKPSRKKTKINCDLVMHDKVA